VFRATDADRLAALIAVHLDGVMVAASIRATFDWMRDRRPQEMLTRYLGDGGRRRSRARAERGL